MTSLTINPDNDKLLTNLLMGVLITLGITYGERVTEQGQATKTNKIISLALFLAGWTGFLLLDANRDVGDLGMRLPAGILIPFTTVLGQIMVMYRQTLMEKTWGYVLMLLDLLLFIAAWVIFVIYKSEDHQEDLDIDVFKYNIIGVIMLLSGTLFYVAMDPSRLDLGEAFRIFENSVYNPSLPMVATGWAFLAIGNSFE